LIILAGLVISFVIVKSRAVIAEEVRGFAFSMIVVTLLYICFGPTVIMHYTGYFKAIALFFFVIPLLMGVGIFSLRKRQIIYFILLSSLVVTTIYNMKVRLLVFNHSFLEKYTKLSTITEDRPISCFKEYRSLIKIDSISLHKTSFFQRVLWGKKDFMLVDVQVKNLGKDDFTSTRREGGVFLSSQWVDGAGNVVVDGVRVALPRVVHPRETVKARIFSYLPPAGENIRFIPSLVQENCVWFYQVEQKSSFHE
jgi:hypothetical protein